MPATRKPKAWNLKPQLTAAPELWKNIIHLVPLWEGVGGPMAIKTKNLPDIILDGAASWVYGSHGRAIKSGTTPALDAGDNPSYSILTPGKESTVVAVFDHTKKDTCWLGGVDAEWALALKAGTSSSYVRFDQFGNNSGLANDIGFGFHVVVAKIRAGTGGEIWLDGKLYKAFENTTTSSDLSAGLTVGGRTGDSTETCDQPILLWAIYDGLLSDDALIKLAKDPFAMLRPAGF